MAVPEHFFPCRVAAASPLSPHLVRLVLTGPGLAGFESTGLPDEWVRLFPPRPGEQRLPMPRRDGAGWAWEGEQPEGRYYTVRDWDRGAGELTIDVVSHAAGIVTSWAQWGPVGDEVVVSSPRGSFAAPVDASWLWLVGDVTALPAIGRIVEQLPDGLPTRVLVEVPDATDQQPLVSRSGLDVTWVEHEPVHGEVSSLERVVRAAPWPQGRGYFWMAGEAGQMRGLRKYLRHELQLPTPSYDVMGYWRFDAERWLRTYEAAKIDAQAIWAEGERRGQDTGEIWDRYEQALDRAGL